MLNRNKLLFSQKLEISIIAVLVVLSHAWIPDTDAKMESNEVIEETQIPTATADVKFLLRKKKLRTAIAVRINRKPAVSTKMRTEQSTFLKKFRAEPLPAGMSTEHMQPLMFRTPEIITLSTFVCGKALPSTVPLKQRA